MTETKEPDWADEFAEQTFGHWNPRFVLYRNQDPTFRQDDIGRLAAVLRRAEQRGYERGIEAVLSLGGTGIGTLRAQEIRQALATKEPK